MDTGADVGRQTELKRLRNAAEAELARGAYCVGLRAPLRDLYQADRACGRSRELTNTCLFGTAAYLGIVMLLNMLVVNSPTWQTVAGRCTVTPFLVFTIAYLSFRPENSVLVREAGALAASCCFSLATLLAICAGPSAVTVLNLFLLSLPVVGVLIFVRLRFGASLAFVAVTAAALWLTLLTRDDVPAALRAYPLVFLLAISAPALFAVYRLEHASRRNYLHELLQGLRIEQLALENGMLSRLSATDVVTGAANRRHLDGALRLLCAEPGGGDFLLLADIDFFKRFNDRHGHLAGDACLREVVNAIRSQLRRTDLVARFGGEEFAIVLSRTTRADAVATAARIREAVATHGVSLNGRTEFVTVSLGVGERHPGTTPAALIALADGALYAAKRSGRNCVRSAVQPTTAAAA